MKLVNINDNIRNIILECIEKIKMEGNTLDESITLFRDNFYDYLDGEKASDEKLLEMIVKIAYADTIKILVYRIKDGTANDIDLIRFNNLKEIDDCDSLHAEISADPSLFEYIIGTCYAFCSINFFGRVNIFNKLSTNEDRWIYNISSTHSMDLMTYKDVELEDIINQISEEIDYQNKNFSESMADSNVMSIVGLIKSIVSSRGSKCHKLLFDIGTIDYSVSKYLSNIIDDEILKDRVDLYENYNVEYILSFLIENEEFLNQAVWMLYSLYFDKSYGKIGLDKTILDNDSSKKMKKKLVLN